MTSDGEDLAEHGELFHEPDDYYPPEKPATFVEHTLQSGQQLRLRLVGHNPLWGHMLWNAGKVVAQYLEGNAEELVKNKDVLELGAGAGLPSLVCAVRGARRVVVTDYPDADLIQNLRYNIGHCELLSARTNIVAKGYIWGHDVHDLTLDLVKSATGFDLLILADILFNHTEHQKLVTSIARTLKNEPGARALVFFTPYRPWLLEKDLAFFDLARDNGFVVEKIMEKILDAVMFENDPGDETLRKTVYGYQLTRDFAERAAAASPLDGDIDAPLSVSVADGQLMEL